MAILHAATLTPTKLELISSFVATIPGFEDTAVEDVALIGAYRFDDPDGKVGMEGHLVDNGAGRTVHVPLTYREAPLEGAEDYFITTMEHTVLGRRWVYDAAGDPVFVQEITRAILEGDSDVEQYFETENGPVLKSPTATAKGTGPVEAVGAGGELVVCRDTTMAETDSPALIGAWADVTSSVLAYLR